MDSLYNTLRSTFALYQCRIQDDLHKRIPPLRNIDDVSDCRPGRCSHNSKPPDILWDLLLVLRCKHSHFLQFFLQKFKAFIQKSYTVPHDFSCIQLVFSISCIDIHHTEYNDLLTFLHTKRKP